MATGAAAAAPGGFTAYCQRQPEDCGASAADIQAMTLAARSPQASPVAAIRYDWAGVFAKQTTPPEPVHAAALTYDWSSAFRKVPTAAADAAPAQAAAPVSITAAGATVPALTPGLWAQINRVNSSVNRAIVRRLDIDTYGVAEVWATPLAAGINSGDCEDYVLEKRRALIAAGLPPEALSIAVVTTLRGEHHAVLLVDTQAGEYVLDNLTPWVLPWRKTSYQWRERQVAGSAVRWASASLPDQRLLLASLR